MKVTDATYLVLGVAALMTVVLVPAAIYRFGTSALPFWTEAVSPGEMSAAHAFLGGQCAACHTPNQGIKATSCITCHAPDAAVLAQQSTAFHATIQTCAGCHVEHQGKNVRPIRIEHSVLTRFGMRAEPVVAGLGQPATGSASAIKQLLAGVSSTGAANDGEALACASCHGVRDKHRTLFGQQCADCHATISWKIAGFLHPSPKSQECSQCHQAPPSHNMMHFAMMDQAITGQVGARVEQCFLCHQTSSFNDIKGVGWFKMH